MLRLFRHTRPCTTRMACNPVCRLQTQCTPAGDSRHKRKKECVHGLRQTPPPYLSTMPREVEGGGSALTSCLKHEKQFLASLQWDIVLLVFCAPVLPQISANSARTRRENRRLPATMSMSDSGPGLQSTRINPFITQTRAGLSSRAPHPWSLLCSRPSLHKSPASLPLSC